MATLPNLKKCVIGVTDISAEVLTAETDDKYDQPIKSITVTFNKTLSGTYPDPVDKTLIGTDFVFSRGCLDPEEEFLCRGEITDVTIEPSKITIVAQNKLFRAVKSELTKSYDQSIDDTQNSAIMTDLYSRIGITTDGTTVTTTSDVMLEFRMDHADFLESMERLAERVGYQFFYDDQSDRGFYQPLGSINNGVVLERSATGNIAGSPNWDFTTNGMVQRVTVIGGQNFKETTETFVADGATSTFTLAKKPVSVKVFVDNVLQDGGEDGVTEGTFDYSKNFELKRIIFQPASIPINLQNVEIQYTFEDIPQSTAENAVSIDTFATPNSGNDNALTATFTRPDLLNFEDVNALALRIVNDRGEPFLRSTTILVNGVTTLNSGETVRAIDSEAGIDNTVFVREIKKFYPYTPDEIIVEDEFLRKDLSIATFDRITRLEELATRNQELLQINKLFSAFILFDSEFTLSKTGLTAGELYYDTDSQGWWSAGWSDGTDTNMSYSLTGADFNGTDSQIAFTPSIIPDDTYTGDFTIAFFVDADTFASSIKTIYYHEDAAGRFIRVRLLQAGTGNERRINVDIRDGTNMSDSVSTTRLDPDVIYRIAIVHDNSTGVTDIYIDGVQETLSSSTADPDVILPTDGDVTLGTESSTNYFDGELRNVQVWNRALTPSDISNDFGGAFLQENLIYYAPLTTNSVNNQGYNWGDGPDIPVVSQNFTTTNI